MKDFKELEKQWMANPEFKKGYDALDSEYQLARSLIEARLAKKMTQVQVAEKAGVGQAVIARLESGTQNPRWATISKVAKALELTEIPLAVK